MFDFIINNLDFFVCGCFCFIHLIVGIISSISQNRKIERICNKCGSPVLEGENHTCTLSYEELSAIVAFVRDLKGDSENVNNQ